MPLEIKAELGREYFAMGERIPLVLSVTNKGTEVSPVADPRRGGDSLMILLMMPNGQERGLTIGEALGEPGVPEILVDMRIPPGREQLFEFDLAKLTRFDRPGNYRAKLIYIWKKGEMPWNSAELDFVIKPPAGTLLEATPTESSVNGSYGVLWTEKEGDRARVLLLDYQLQNPVAEVRGAREIARIPLAAAPVLSMEPGGLPFSEKWMAWTSQQQLHVLYHADTVENQLGPRAIPLSGIEPRLVRPLLAEPAPDEGRPGCMIGVVTGGSTGTGSLTPVEINEKGEPRVLAAKSLQGTVLEAWATAPTPSKPMFILAIRVGENLDVLSLNCPWRGTVGEPTVLLSMHAELLAGDVRATFDGQAYVGLLLKRDEKWERMSFVVPKRGTQVEPTITPLQAGRGATAARARLDGSGRLHVLLRRNDRIGYVPPGENWDTLLDDRLVGAGTFFDLLLPPEFPATLIYYDDKRGPVPVSL